MNVSGNPLSGSNRSVSSNNNSSSSTTEPDFNTLRGIAKNNFDKARVQTLDGLCRYLNIKLNNTHISKLMQFMDYLLLGGHTEGAYKNKLYIIYLHREFEMPKESAINLLLLCQHTNSSMFGFIINYPKSAQTIFDILKKHISIYDLSFYSANIQDGQKNISNIIKELALSKRITVKEFNELITSLEDPANKEFRSLRDDCKILQSQYNFALADLRDVKDNVELMQKQSYSKLDQLVKAKLKKEFEYCETLYTNIQQMCKNAINAKKWDVKIDELIGENLPIIDFITYHTKLKDLAKQTKLYIELDTNIENGTINSITSLLEHTNPTFSDLSLEYQQRIFLSLNRYNANYDYEQMGYVFSLKNPIEKNKTISDLVKTQLDTLFTQFTQTSNANYQENCRRRWGFFASAIIKENQDFMRQYNHVVSQLRGVQNLGELEINQAFVATGPKIKDMLEKDFKHGLGLISQVKQMCEKAIQDGKWLVDDIDGWIKDNVIQLPFTCHFKDIMEQITKTQHYLDFKAKIKDGTIDSITGLLEHTKPTFSDLPLTIQQELLLKFNYIIRNDLDTTDNLNLSAIYTKLIIEIDKDTTISGTVKQQLDAIYKQLVTVIPETEVANRKLGLDLCIFIATKLKEENIAIKDIKKSLAELFIEVNNTKFPEKNQPLETSKKEVQNFENNGKRFIQYLKTDCFKYLECQETILADLEAYNKYVANIPKKPVTEEDHVPQARSAPAVLDQNPEPLSFVKQQKDKFSKLSRVPLDLPKNNLLIIKDLPQEIKDAKRRIDLVRRFENHYLSAIGSPALESFLSETLTENNLGNLTYENILKTNLGENYIQTWKDNYLVKHGKELDDEKVNSYVKLKINIPILEAQFEQDKKNFKAKQIEYLAKLEVLQNQKVENIISFSSNATDTTNNINQWLRKERQKSNAISKPQPKGKPGISMAELTHNHVFSKSSSNSTSAIEQGKSATRKKINLGQFGNVANIFAKKPDTVVNNSNSLSASSPNQVGSNTPPNQLANSSPAGGINLSDKNKS